MPLGEQAASARVAVVVAPTHLSDAFHAALGRVASHFAVLENVIQGLAWSLIDPRDQQVGQIVTAQMSFGRTVDLAGSIFRHRVGDEALREQLMALLNRALAVEERRNAVTHSIWGFDESPDSAQRIKSTAKKNRGLDHRFERMHAADVDRIALDAAAVASDLLGFRDKLPAALVGRVEIEVGSGTVTYRVP